MASCINDSHKRIFDCLTKKGYLISSLILGTVATDSFLFFVTRSHAQQGSMNRQLTTEDLFLGNLDFCSADQKVG
jgi:hypothetical protein